MEEQITAVEQVMNIIIFGAGDIGKRVYYELLSGRISLNTEIFYYDNDVRKQGAYINDILVLTYEKFIEKMYSEKCEIILAADSWRELLTFLQARKLDDRIKAIFNSFNFYLNPYVQQVYGQEAEDLYLKEYFDYNFGKDYKCFYIDVGAHHPYRFSNTYWAYLKGGCGINIEANLDAIALFNKARPRDVNVNCGISCEEGIMKYYKFDESALNTFDQKEFMGYREPREVVDVSVRTLKSVLSENKVKKIDFMSIDVEGFEMNVLLSNDWNKYRPRLILVEQKDTSVCELTESDVYCFFKNQGYECECKGRRTAIYQQKTH